MKGQAPVEPEPELAVPKPTHDPGVGKDAAAPPGATVLVTEPFELAIWEKRLADSPD